MTSQEANAPLLESKLPLLGYKKIPLKIYGIVALIVLVAGINLLFSDGSEQPKVEKEGEANYELKTVNPASHTDKLNNEIQLETLPNNEKLKQELAEAKAKDFVERLQASQSLSGGNVSTSSTQVAMTSTSDPQNGNMANASDANTAFLERAGAMRAPRVFAQRFTPQPYLIGQGKFIFATLAVAANSDLPGQMTAVVSQDVYGEQGRKVLIPRGSRLIGEYRSGLANNQSRLFVVWTRVIQPNGLSIMIGSEGTDQLGRAGMTGAVDYHFFARFGGATLLSLIGAGAANVGVNPNDEYNSIAAYRQAIAQSFSQQAASTLNQTVNIPPTVHVAQGERVVVFVNKDLDFSRVYR